MTFVDTSAWFAILVPGDQNHHRANTWLKAYPGQLLTSDFVIDETLTLPRSRGQGDEALDWEATMFGPNSPAAVHYLTPAEVAAGWDVFRRFADKDWSFTDCTSKTVMESLGIATAFSFDQHFRQFGTVTVVP
ncbi:MAG TPA: PIN domain-containing protein [Fimbriiglobus sp.]|nr:PIN domain-containing protein [Fimbriiglobus sp.]